MLRGTGLVLIKSIVYIKHCFFIFLFLTVKFNIKFYVGFDFNRFFLTKSKSLNSSYYVCKLKIYTECTDIHRKKQTAGGKRSSRKEKLNKHIFQELLGMSHCRVGGQPRSGHYTITLCRTIQIMLRHEHNGQQ